MFPTNETRASVALQQAALINALISRGEPPPGFDPQRVMAAAESLTRKRARSAARAWPELAHAMGETFGKQFTAYAAASPLPGKGGQLADGYAFARWLASRGCLPDAGRLEKMALELRYKPLPAGLVRRRWPTLRVAWSGQSRRVTLAIRLPRIGERWLSF